MSNVPDIQSITIVHYLTGDYSMTGYIYKTTNLINNKIYIGQKKSTKFLPNYFGSGKLIKEAIKKYGKENFIVDMIEFIDEEFNQKIIDEKERYWINFFNSTDHTLGYNISYGGQYRFFTGQHHTQEAKDAVGNANRGHICSWKGKTKENCESLQKLSNATKGKAKNYAVWNKGLTAEMDERVKYTTDCMKEANKLKGNIPWNKGLTKDDPRVKQYAENRLKNNPDIQKGEKNGFFGKHHTEEAIEKNRQAHLGKEPINKGKKAINNGIETLYIFPEEYEEYEKLGFIWGYRRKE